MTDKLKSHQNEQVIIMPEATLEVWLGEYSDEELDAIADLWQGHAGQRYKNVIVAEEENAKPA